MLINCPNCSSQVEQHRPPSRVDPSAGDSWMCLKCSMIVCVDCYFTHSQKAHPELVQPKKRPTEGGKKNSHRHKR